MAERALQNNDDKHLPKITTDAKKKDVGVERKLRDVFISEDAGGIGEYLIWGVFVPAIKGMLRDAGYSIVDGLFGIGGKTRSSGYYNYANERRYRNAGEPSYRSYYNTPRNKRDRDDDTYDRRSRSRSRDTEVVFKSRAEAEEVRDTLCETIERYGSASISDLNDLCGFDDEYTDRKWGWYDISSSRIRSTKDGYVLEMPRTESLED